MEVICEIYSLFTINTNKLNDLLSLDLGWEVLRTVTLEGGRYINITYCLDFEWLTLSPKDLESSFLHCLPYTLSQDSPGNLVFKSQALMTNQHCEDTLHCSKKTPEFIQIYSAALFIWIFLLLTKQLQIDPGTYTKKAIAHQIYFNTINNHVGLLLTLPLLDLNLLVRAKKINSRTQRL